ncbi:hypothetical protein CsatB_026832 [Cannabis sativa]
MATTRSGSKSPSPAKKISKISKKPPTISSKVDPKMSLKRIAKKGVSDVAEPSSSKKRPILDKIESHKAKRAKSSKSAKDVISDSDFEDEVHDREVKPKVKSKSMLRAQRSLKTLTYPKKILLSDDNHFCVVDFFFFLVVFKLLYHFCSHKLCVVADFVNTQWVPCEINLFE